MGPKRKALERSSASTAGSHRLRPTKRRKSALDGYESSAVHERLDDPSNQIRLLLATHSRRDDVLAFKISTHSLTEAPAYFAISYTWGRDDTQRFVVVNSVDFAVEFCVNQNCYYALYQACLHYAETPLWIDSLCIDQSDFAEKSAQVWIMPEIYRGAARVLACVGPHADNSMKLAPAVPEVERLKQLENTPYKKTTYNADYEVKEFAQLVRESLGLQSLLRLFRAFKGFKRRPYWKRLWIQQEVGLAAEVDILCGGHLLSWRSIQLLLELYRETLDNITYHREWQYEADWFHRYYEGALEHKPFENLISLLQHDEFELGRLLSFSKGLHCEDFHDRVYGVLGLARPWVRKRLLPDYNLTAIQLALQVASVVSFQHVHAVLENLGIDYRDIELQSLVKQRQSSDVVVDHVAPKGSERCRCYLIRGDREGELTAVGALVPLAEQFDRYCYQYTIRTDGDGLLTTDMAGHHSGPSDNDDLDAQATLFNAKRIVVNGQTAGFICHSARDGDVIVQLLAMNKYKFLVLRHSDAELYNLVGRGFLLPGYYLTDFDIASGNSHESYIEKKRVAVRVSTSPEESIAFWAMQLEEQKRKEPRRTMDMITRLDASITSHPHGAVQITDLETLKTRSREAQEIEHSNSAGT